MRLSRLRPVLAFDVSPTAVVLLVLTSSITLVSLKPLVTTLTVPLYNNNIVDNVKRVINDFRITAMKARQWKVTITLSQEMYEQLQARADKEARTLASLGKYLLLKGLEAEKTETSNR